MCIEPLTREELKSVIEGKSAAGRIPTAVHFWIDPEVSCTNKQKAADLLAKYPSDIVSVHINTPKVFDAPEDDPGYRWADYDKPFSSTTEAIDSAAAISDWEQLDGILSDFPDAGYKGLLPDNPENDGRYRLGYWWYCLFERLWSLRGMTNALTDFYTNPECVHRLFRRLTDFYIDVMERSKKELNLDGIFTSDDLGTQTNSFFSLEIFNEFFKPYYRELIEKAHTLGMHFWLHTCGNIELFLPGFIEINLDVIHPIQKYTMNEKAISEKFGNDICIWAGFDVQQIIPYGTPEDVRREVRYMIDTYFKPEGRLIITAGNMITGDCRIESLEALLDETYRYGTDKILKYGGNRL